MCWAPGNLHSIWGRALGAVEVDAQGVALCCRAIIDGDIRDTEKAVPDVVWDVDSCRDLAARFPDPTCFMGWIVQIYVQVDPLALRGDFKLLVAADVIEVGADKDFSHIPVPKLVGFGAEVWFGFQVELLVRADEEEAEILRRPLHQNRGCMTGNGIAQGIVDGNNGWSAEPETGLWVGVRRGIVDGKSCYCLV